MARSSANRDNRLSWRDRVLRIVTVREAAPFNRTGLAPMLESHAAIARLEEAIIPWQRQTNASQEEAVPDPARRLRQTHAGGALAAAESFLRGSLRPGPTGAHGRRPADHAASGAACAAADPAAGRQQLARLREWAHAHDRLIHPRLVSLLDRGQIRVGGVEHDVFHEVSTGRWVKLTLPGRSGKELQAQVEMPGVRPTLFTTDALPVDYLRRLLLANELLGDDFCFHGVLDDPAGPRLVISQSHIRGEHAGTEAIAQHFLHIGFQPINAKTFYDPEENLLVSDAHDGNVLRTTGGLLVPFDVCVQRPTGALRDAVTPAATLDFGPVSAQGALGF